MSVFTMSFCLIIAVIVVPVALMTSKLARMRFFEELLFHSRLIVASYVVVVCTIAVIAVIAGFVSPTSWMLQVIAVILQAGFAGLLAWEVLDFSHKDDKRSDALARMRNISL